jgi:hypothetical protein
MAHYGRLTPQWRLPLDRAAPIGCEYTEEATPRQLTFTIFCREIQLHHNMMCSESYLRTVMELTCIVKSKLVQIGV